MYSFLKNITLNSIFPLLIITMAFVYILHWQIAFATDAPDTDAISGQGSVEITIAEGKISADIKKVPLKDVLGKLEKEYGLLYEADEKVLKREVSVRFDGLPMKEGINKILSPLNYLIVSSEKDKQKKLFILDVYLGDAVTLGTGKLREGSLPAGSVPSDYKLLPKYNPDEFDRDSFLTPPQDYKPLPQYTPRKITSGPFVEPPPDYRPLPEYIPREITSGPFVEPPPDYKPLPPFTPREETNDKSAENDSGQYYTTTP